MRGRNLELIHNLIVEYRRVLFNCLAGPACNHYILQEIGWERGGGGNGGSQGEGEEMVTHDPAGQACDQGATAINPCSDLTMVQTETLISDK